MSAKHKLNSAHLLWSLFVAGLFGVVTQSLTLFLIALAALLIAALQAGNIRG